MKIKAEHYVVLLQGLRENAGKLPPRAYVVEVAQRERPTCDGEMLYRWELLHTAFSGANELAGDRLLSRMYDYANDAHIDTALRAAIREI